MDSSIGLLDLASGQKKIDNLLSDIEIRFKQAKTKFEKEHFERLSNENVHLSLEVERLRDLLVQEEIKAGVVQICVPKKDKEGTVNAAILNTESKSTENGLTKAKFDKKEKSNIIVTTEAKNIVKSEAKKEKNTSDDDVIDIGRINLKVGRIIDVKKHPDADSLYVESIDVGEDKPRTVVSGLVKWVPLEEMQNRLVVVMCNLKPAKMRGIESQAMVMCASSPDKIELMQVDPEAVPGTPVYCTKYPYRPDSVLNPKKKIWETVAPDLKVSSDGLAVFKDDQLLVGGKSPMKAPTLRNVNIK